MFCEQLLTNFFTIFVINVLDVVTLEKLVEVHNKHTKEQDFEVNFEVCTINFFSFVFSYFALQMPL